MKAFTHSVACVLLAVMAGAGVCTAQRSDAQYFRQMPVPARAVSIGEASVADVHTASAAVWNPASLVYLESIAVDATLNAGMDGRTAQGAVMLPVVAKAGVGLAVGGHTAFIDPSDWSSKAGTLYGGNLSYAMRITPTFSVGALYNIESATYGGTSVTAQNFGIGMMYTALPAFSYGAALTGIGSGIIYHKSDTLHAIEREGQIPRSITLGASWHYPTTHDRVVFTYYLGGQKIIGVEQVIYRMGLEILPWKFLSLRGGVVSGPYTSVGRFGFGLRTSIVEIDYAIASSRAEERTHTVTISLPIFTR